MKWISAHKEANTHARTQSCRLVQIFKLIEIWEEQKETLWTNIPSGYLWPFLHLVVDEWHTVLKLNMVSFKSQINQASVSSLWFIHLHHFWSVSNQGLWFDDRCVLSVTDIFNKLYAGANMYVMDISSLGSSLKWWQREWNMKAPHSTLNSASNWQETRVSSTHLIKSCWYNFTSDQIHHSFKISILSP